MHARCQKVSGRFGVTPTDVDGVEGDCVAFIEGCVEIGELGFPADVKPKQPLSQLQQC